jgi:NADPH2:quinone reductase
MKAIRIHQTGGPEVLKYEETETPEPAAGELRVKVQAIGVNFVDVYFRNGSYKNPLPFIPGREAAGEVDAIGANVSEFRVGDRVAFAMYPGAYAEYTVLPATRFVSIPDGISAREAAAVLLQGMTAQYLTFSTYPLDSTKTALIHAAAGGSGQMLVQVAKMLGARIIATVSTQEKARIAREIGADEVILYSKVDFEPEVKRLTDGKGVDVVYDSVGKDTFERGLDCLKPRGMMVLWGQASGPVAPIDPLTLQQKGSLYLSRPTLIHYIADRAELVWRASEVFQWLKDAKLRPRIDKTLPLAEAADAHRHLEGRAAMGKVLLVP